MRRLSNLRTFHIPYGLCATAYTVGRLRPNGAIRSHRAAPVSLPRRHATHVITRNQNQLNLGVCHGCACHAAPCHRPAILRMCVGQSHSSIKYGKWHHRRCGTVCLAHHHPQSQVPNDFEWTCQSPRATPPTRRSSLVRTPIRRRMSAPYASTQLAPCLS